MKAKMNIAVVIPALNEAAAIGHVLDAIPPWVDAIVAVDNGSTDSTAAVARQHGASVVFEPRRGYGAACLRGLSALESPDIVVFLDADNSDDPNEMTALIEPIEHSAADLVIGSRTLGQADRGSLTRPQRFGNALASALMRRIWKQTCTDLGPFRAIRFSALMDLGMNDLDYGWTVQMQARAFRLGLRVVEVPVRYRKRIGRSKISGTVRGVVGAGTKILATIAREALTQSTERRTRRCLLIFTRFPEPGVTKTRMIPALGAEGAAQLQHDMTNHTLSVARRWRRRTNDTIIVSFSGGTAAAMQEAFGADVVYRPQGEGSLGDRMYLDFQRAYDDGYQEIVVIGADCPSIDASVLNRAFTTLKSHDVVIGPATDGGYYLIGMHSPQREMFQDITWGTPQVLEQSLTNFERLRLHVAQLDTRPDVDEPADLVAWEEVSSRTAVHPPVKPRLSIIIPTLNEEICLYETLSLIREQPDAEVIVADGGSVDHTCAIAGVCGARIVRSAPGRAIQMNAGAAVASGDILLFLHADTRLPFGFFQQIESCLDAAGTAAGAFRFAVDETRLSLRLIEIGANWRSTKLQFPFGDQGIFLCRETFQKVGGFRDLPTMEDYDLVQRLRKVGRVVIASSAVITSARRWLKRGVWCTTFDHLLMLLGWNLGISPHRLARWRAETGKPASRFVERPGGQEETLKEEPPHLCGHGNELR